MDVAFGQVPPHPPCLGQVHGRLAGHRPLGDGKSAERLRHAVPQRFDQVGDQRLAGQLRPQRCGPLVCRERDTQRIG